MSVYRIITRIIPLNSSVSTFQPASFEQLTDGQVGEVKVLNLTEPNSGMKYRIERVEYVQNVRPGESVESINDAYAEKLKNIPGFVQLNSKDVPSNPYDKSFQLTLPKVLSGKASSETSKSQQKKSTESFKISVVKNFNFKKASPKARKSMKCTLTLDSKEQSISEDTKSKAIKPQSDSKALFKSKYPSYLSKKLKHSVWKKKSSTKPQTHLKSAKSNDSVPGDFSKKNINIKNRNGLTSHFVETNKGKNGRESLKIKISNLNHKEKTTVKNHKEKTVVKNHKDINAVKNHKGQMLNHEEKDAVKNHKEKNVVKNHQENITVDCREKCITVQNHTEKDKNTSPFDGDADKTRNSTITNNDTSSDMTDEASLDSDCGQLVISVLESVENGTIPEDLLGNKNSSEDLVANKNPPVSKSSSVASDDSLLEDSSSLPHQNGCAQILQFESEDCDDICKKFIVGKDHPAHDLLIALKKYFVNGECLICGFIPKDNNFNASEHMESHILSNTFASSYKCKCCDEKFSDPRNLYMHSLSREKCYKYTCDICTLKFKRRHYLSRHTAKSH